MSRRLCSVLVLAALACAFGRIALAADDVTNVVVGKGKTGTASKNSVVIVEDKIYVDGVLQEQRYKPGMDMIIRDDKILFVPHDASRDAEKAAAKAAAKVEREREKEALKRETSAGLEKGKIKTSTGRVINKGGTVRIGNKDYPDTGPATEADIPPDALKAIEDAKRLGQ